MLSNYVYCIIINKIVCLVVCHTQGVSILKKLVKVLFIVVIVSAIWRYAVIFKDSYLIGERTPYIQMLTPDSVVVRWLTTDNQLGIIRFAEDYQYLSNIQLEGSPTKNHSVKLINLKPATKYYYQTGEVGSFKDVDTQHQWFYTPSLVTVPTRIWVIGDSGVAGETMNQVYDSAFEWMRQQARNSIDESMSLNPGLIDVWIALGDMAYPSGSNAQYQTALFEPYENLLANTVLWPIYGHRDDRRWTYFKIFDIPENAEVGGVASHTENYYSMDYSNIHFVMLDSQASDRSVEGKMLNWLKRDLAANKKPWLIAAFHHPAYSKGHFDTDDDNHADGRSKDMREQVLPILEAAGVDLVLSSYSHSYQRSFLIDCAYQQPDSFSAKNIVSNGISGENKQYIKSIRTKSHQGTVYVVVGSSSTVDKKEINHPVNHIALLEAGSMVIDVDNNKLIARFINDKGELRDEFSIRKEAGFNSAYQGCE